MHVRGQHVSKSPQPCTKWSVGTNSAERRKPHARAHVPVGLLIWRKQYRQILLTSVGVGVSAIVVGDVAAAEGQNA